MACQDDEDLPKFVITCYIYLRLAAITRKNVSPGEKFAVLLEYQIA